MALKADDPGFCRVLVEEGKEATKRHLHHAREAIEKYHGGFWVDASGGGSNEFTPENTYYEYATAMLPRLVFHNPRVRATSRRSGPQADVALAMRHGLNRLVRDARLNWTLRDVVLDMLFAFGVILVKETERDGLALAQGDPIEPAKPTWPMAQRVPPTKFFMDPIAYDWGSTRYRGHEWRMDKEDLLKLAKDHPEQGWRTKAIKDLPISSPDEDRDMIPVDRPAAHQSREEVVAHDIWFPEIELDESPGPEEGFFGTVFTLAEMQSGNDDGAQFIRDPRPFYGPRTGPYTLFGVYKVPDSPFPLAPLAAVEAQIRELNVHARVNSENQRKYKRMVGVKDRSTAEKIKNQPHDHVVAMGADDLRQSIGQFELAGLSEQAVVYEERMKERTNRMIGMDETMRGTSEPGATATATTLASESAVARISEIKAAVINATEDVLYSLGHYLYYSDTSVFPVSDIVFQEVGVKIPEYPGLEVVPWYRGGDPDRKKGYTFDDLELDIEPYSMERTSEGLQMQRMMQAHELLMGMLPAMERFPDFPWPEWLKKLGDAMNLPNLEELVRPEMLERLTKQLEMMTQQQVQQQQAAPQGPRFQGQVGTGGPASSSKSQASQGTGKPTAARTQGQGMPGQQQGGMQMSKPAKMSA